MSSSEISIDLYVNCGHYKFTSANLNIRSTIDQVHQEVRTLCGSFITGPYCLMFYHPERRKLMKLNQNYLTDEFNLFRIRSSPDDIGYHFVELYVIDMSDEDESECSISENVSQQDLPISKTITNNCPNGELFNALLSQEQNLIMNNNYSIDHEDSFDSLLLSNDPIERIPNGVVIPSQNHSTETMSRLYFSLDVKPEQKDIHKSDQFNRRDQTKTNGYVAHVQGIKTPEQNKASIWPKIRIPSLFRHRNHMKLVVYVVSERIENDRRLWFIHRDKAFLPKSYTRNSIPINPIEFDINQQTLTFSGDFELDLQMTILWNKTNQSQLLYQLDERNVIELHSAKHDPFSPRLLCLLKIDQLLHWETICLSDFIRKKSSSKRKLTQNQSSNLAIECKRTKAN